MVEPIPLLNTGIYSLGQAARLIRAEPRAVRRWMCGYTRKHGDGRRYSGPLWRTQLDGADFDQAAIGFRDLMELRLVRAFADAGVSVPVIRATIDAARADLNTDYPLTTRRFMTDGKRIYESAIDEVGDEMLTDVQAKQIVFTHVIKPSLYAGIEYDGNVARAWFPPDSKGIALDPSRQFGTPIVADAGVPTDTLYEAFVAEGRDARAVARQFDIAPKHVHAAVRYEERLRA
ncbi:DUF433 domain-containing protein [Variovorax rhizosphaerae]|uniref:DUF433 domain-containing protein n=1 Tax=Variovorax rhizosphaerae TaxID=1836200 RepID=A0ABU8WYM0_9BURK